MKANRDICKGFCLSIAYVTIAALVAATSGSVLAEPVQVGHVRAELVPEMDTIAPGQPFTVGLHLEMDEHWHVYWRNAGDAGLPPKVTWELPEGFSAGEIQWPYPEKFSVPPLMSYGFYGSVLLPVTITSPSDLTTGETVELIAKAEWLVCKEACIPGKAELPVVLPVGEAPSVNEQWGGAFAQVREKLPLQEHGWGVAVGVSGETVTLNLTPPEWYRDSLTEVTFLPHESKVIENAAPQTLEVTESGYRLTVERSHYSLEAPETVSGILISEDGWRGPASEKALEFTAAVNASGDTPPVAATSGWDSGIFKALLFAFLGGMILNLMPCVLPVLSLKVLGFVQQANESRSKSAAHGLVFTGGVLLSFWALAAVLMALRAGGQELGWGFQLQSPAFLVVLSVFMFLFGLNLLGVFEIGSSLTTVGGGKTSGMGGSFLNGVTATVVATPCTAPFMGSALGFSLTQQVWVGWLIFTALGLGMAAPYVVLSMAPGLLRFVPKPGRWMETLKQIMGFLLLATVIWLAWVLGVQAGINAVAALMVVLLVTAIGAWVMGRWGSLSQSTGKRRVAYVTAAVLVLGAAGGGLAGVEKVKTEQTATASVDGGIRWEPFSRERLRELRAGDKPVFVDFTAAWCLSCKVNERVALGAESVQDKFDEMEVVALKADWTSRSDEITRALAEYGRNSVPLYLLFAPGDGDAKILPEILTPGIVLEALNEIDS